MKTWRVYGIVTGTKYLGKFKAETKEEAIEKAMEDAYCSLCHECDSECEDPHIHSAEADEIESKCY